MLKKGGIKPKALVEDEINTIVVWIEDDCGLTVKQVKIKVLANFCKNVSTSTIGNYLDGRLFTMKQGHKQPISMNSEENKRKRAKYVTALNRYIELGKQIVWIEQISICFAVEHEVGPELVCELFNTYQLQGVPMYT
nr:unnamed protein product [Callosobruchus analis]